MGISGKENRDFNDGKKGHHRTLTTLQDEFPIEKGLLKKRLINSVYQDD